MLEGFADTGAEVPALDRRPEILGLEWIWAAFWDLTSCRAIGFAVGAIPWTAIHLYCEAEKMSPFESRMLHAAIRAMDGVYLGWLKKKK